MQLVPQSVCVGGGGAVLVFKISSYSAQIFPKKGQVDTTSFTVLQAMLDLVLLLSLQ